MAKRIDITGQKFGRLLAVKFAGVSSDRALLWHCVCDCGKETITRSKLMRRGHTKSCGCFNLEKCREPDTHGASKTNEYNLWVAMKRRCYNPNSQDFHNWGGRGIRVCDAWRNSFETFLADMGPRPSLDHSVGRIDSDKDYGPNNCRWATRLEQANNKRSNRLFTVDGKTLTMKQWAAEVGLPYGCLIQRINKLKWPIERALTEPMRQWPTR
jgi:hypothetical protein